MDESLESIFKNLVKNIPQRSRDLLTSFDWAKEVDSIVQGYNLPKESSDIIKTLILFAFADESERSGLNSSFQNELSIDPETAIKIQKEIENRIFNRQPLNAETKIFSSFETQIPQVKNFIEDAKGNSDNTIPSTIVSSTTKEPQQSKPQTAAPQTTLEQKIANQSNPELSAMVKKHYPGQDPYREPIN